jgi:hypothetical protein
MKKVISATLLTTTLLAVPSMVLANKEHSIKVKAHIDASASVSPQPTCNPGQEWKNHGSYVSCVAKQHLGGAVISAAAKSSIGKHSQKSPEPSSSLLPTASPSSSPSSFPSSTPSPTATSSASPVGVSIQSISTLQIELKMLIDTLQNILKSMV